MHYFSYPIEDATLYEGSSSMNTGLDEVIEVRKDVSDGGASVNVSRIVMKFDLAEVSSSIHQGLIPPIASGSKFYLNLKDAGSHGLETSQSLKAYSLRRAWLMGRGKKLSRPLIEEGASWDFFNGKTEGGQWSGSVDGTGGWWHTGSLDSASYDFSHTNRDNDVRMDVTNIVGTWLNGTRTNYGFIIKRSGSVSNDNIETAEGSSDSLGHLKFFSRDTHTIYVPTLEAQWNDATWHTSSLQRLNGRDLDDVVVNITNLNHKYAPDSKVRIRVQGRPAYPTLTNSPSASVYTKAKYLPSGSQYSIVDAVTEDTIVPFGSGSFISCDSRGNFMDVWFKNFQPERSYKFLFKVVSGSEGSFIGTRNQEIIDRNYEFIIQEAGA
tara:strand:+ start:10838 stop:11977 length:1140 start_codon:yes stop_codon:yes gene_type:complete